jgi:hypothetical protein
VQARSALGHPVRVEFPGTPHVSEKPSSQQAPAPDGEVNGDHARDGSTVALLDLSDWIAASARTQGISAVVRRVRGCTALRSLGA